MPCWISSVRPKAFASAVSGDPPSARSPEKGLVETQTTNSSRAGLHRRAGWFVDPRNSLLRHTPVTKERRADLVTFFDRPLVRTCFCMFYRKSGTAPALDARTGGR